VAQQRPASGVVVHAANASNVEGSQNPPEDQSVPVENLDQSIVLIPLTQLKWDGHWPKLAAQLNLRAVAQQLAFQSELIQCEMQGTTAVLICKCLWRRCFPRAALRN